MADNLALAAFEEFQRRYDPAKGGFGRSRKFPVPQNFMFLLRHHHRSGNKEALQMVEHTLSQIRLGGVYDHVGHGIHRYSIDPHWLVPHFEKMLYDQALFALACLEARQVTGKEEFASTARDVLGYVASRMTSPEGGFYSAEDADSEGVEGKFYVWNTKEIKELLGEEDGAFFIRLFNLTDEGNFLEEARQVKTGDNIPHLTASLSPEEEKRFEPLRLKLFESREKRIHPQKDDKILTDWNGLMIAAFARAGQVLDDPAYVAQARAAADFVLARLTTPEGRLLKRYRAGNAGLTAHLEDYAFLIWGLLDLYEASFELPYLERALAFQGILDQFFLDQENGGYFMTASDSEKLLARVKKLYGGAIPGGNEAAALNLARLYRITGRRDYLDKLEKMERAFSASVTASPSEVPLFLCALDFKRGPGQEIVLSGSKGDSGVQALAAAIRKPFLPGKVLVFRDDQAPEKLVAIAPHTREQISLGGKATAYVCRDFACQLPTTDLAQVMENLLGKNPPGK